MKSLLPLFLAALFILSFQPEASAQDFPKVDKSPMDMAYYPNRAAFRNFEKTEEAKKANAPKIRVLYSRPMKKGRDIFGDLLKFGTNWRLGANETTEIQFYQDVEIGGSKVAAGTYTVYAILGEKEWNVIFNTDLDGWGAYAYNEGNDVARVQVPVETTESTIEAFSIMFAEAQDGAHMVMGWDDTIVRVPIKF
jgi:hypothetical protein